MNITSRPGVWIVCLMLAALVGCTPHKIYRTEYSLCEAAKPEEVEKKLLSKIR